MDILLILERVAAAVLHGEPKGFGAVLSIMLGLGGMWSLWLQWRMDRWLSTIGQLFRDDLPAWESSIWLQPEQGLRQTVGYRYRVGQREFEGYELSPWKITLTRNSRWLVVLQRTKIERVGTGRVRVFYNPNRPEQAFLLRSGMLGKVVTLGFIGLMWALPVVWFGTIG